MESALKQLVRQRADGRCEYCQIPSEYDCLTFQVDHVIAAKHGGIDDPDNLALACWSCNVRKGPNIAGVDPTNDQVVPLFHPRRQVWAEHFRWAGAELHGLTPEGRATIQVLGINLSHRVALRASLIEEGAIPPS
jgi:hypothetical protein